MIKYLLAIGVCVSVMLTGCAPYTPTNSTTPTYTSTNSQSIPSKGQHRDWGAFKECNKGYCFWTLGTRLEGIPTSSFEMTFLDGSLMMGRLVFNLKQYPSSSFVSNNKLYITIDGEKTFTLDATAYISSQTKHVPIIFMVSKDTEFALIYYMTHGYTATLVLEAEGGEKVKMKISLMGFTKMLRLAKQ